MWKPVNETVNVVGIVENGRILFRDALEMQPRVLTDEAETTGISGVAVDGLDDRKGFSYKKIKLSEGTLFIDKIYVIRQC